MKTTFQRVVSYLLPIIWLAVVVFIAFHHEFWRDEVRALSIAKSANGFINLQELLQNEGHPVLWYFILWITYQFFESNLVLQFTSIAIAFGGILLFVKKSPFSIIHHLLFAFGIFALYEYSVMARNYGISMLLLFWIGYLFSNRSNAVWKVVALCLLALTNVHSIIFTALILFYWLFEIVFGNRESIALRMKNLIYLLPVAAVALFSAYSVIPTEETIVVSTKVAIHPQLIVDNILNIGKNYDLTLPGTTVFQRTIIIWILIAGVLFRPVLSLILFLGFVSSAVFADVIGINFLRHQGLAFMFLLMIYWIAFYKKTDYFVLQNLYKLNLNIIIPVILIFQMISGYEPIMNDIKKEVSSSKSFGKWLKEDAQFKDAVIIGEPDYHLESLPAYANNRIFLAREGIYSDYVHFTKQSRVDLSLGELLQTAKNIHEETKQPVLITIGHFEIYNKLSGNKRFSYNKHFSWNENELKEFMKQTELVKKFVSADSDERYMVFVYLHEAGKRSD